MTKRTICIQTIKVKSSSDHRAKFHNGFWALKFIAVSGLVVGAFFVPNTGFDRAWMIVGLVGGFVVSLCSSFLALLDILFQFILVQLLLSIDFVHA